MPLRFPVLNGGPSERVIKLDGLVGGDPLLILPLPCVRTKIQERQLSLHEEKQTAGNLEEQSQCRLRVCIRLGLGFGV